MKLDFNDYVRDEFKMIGAITIKKEDHSSLKLTELEDLKKEPWLHYWNNLTYCHLEHSMVNLLMPTISQWD